MLCIERDSLRQEHQATVSNFSASIRDLVVLVACCRRRIAKCNDLMIPVLGAKTKPLIDRVLAMEKVKDIRELRPLLQAAPHTGAPRLSDYPNAKS
jgi:hypothetical protein